MVLPSSGNPISLLNLQLEYDDTAPTSLNEFYGQANAPASGAIDLADFYAAAGTAAVTSNLVFELDARNSSSWSGSGSTWYDTTSNNRDFTLVNGPTGTTVGGVTAINFDGSNDYAEIADGTWIPDGTNPWTCEVYVYIDSWTRGSFAANERLMFTKTSPSNQGMSLGFIEESDGNVYMLAGTQGGGNVNGANDRYNMGTHTNYEGVWFHAVWTYDGSNLKYYIDGSNVATFTGRNFHSNSAPLRLMCLDPSNSSYSMNVDGKLSVARMYSAALSASNVTTNRANCTGGVAATDSVLTVSPTSHQGNAFTATFTFDKNVGLFDTNDITVTGGSKGTFTAVSKKVYTLAITPSGNSNLTITVPASASVNSANLDNNAINLTVTYSTFTTSGLVCHLDANDSSSYGGSGTTWTDLSSSSNNATLNNGPTYVSSTPKHFTFDGSNDYAEVTRMVGNGSFSLAAWINTTSHSGNGGSGNFWNGFGVVDTEQGGSGDFGLVVKDGSAGFGCGNNTTIWSSPGSYPVTDGDWHYILATRNASTGEIILYVDGYQAAQNSTSGGTNALTDTSTIRIGRTYSGARYYNGKIAEVHIYNDVLTSTEVSTNYNDGVSTYYTPVITASGSHSGSAFTHTINFSTEVNGFTASDITVTNASKGSLSGSGKTYTITLTPTGNNDIAFSIGANAVTSVKSSAGNPAYSTTISYVTLGRTSGTGTLFQGASSTGTTASGWTNVRNGSADDANVEIPLGFTWTINNTGYTSVFVGSNNYITFGGGHNDYSGYSFSSWSKPKIIMTQTSDNSYQYVTYKQFSGYTRIRFEGNASTGGSVGSGNIVWECTFFSSSLFSNPTVEVRCGSNGRGTSRTMGIGGPSSAYASHSSLVNNSVVYEGNSTGTSFTAYTSQYIQGYSG